MDLTGLKSRCQQGCVPSRSLPDGASVKNLPANARVVRDVGSIPGSQPTLIFLPGESHGQRSLVGYRPWLHKE